jgi:UrcA family protein
MITPSFTLKSQRHTAACLAALAGCVLATTVSVAGAATPAADVPSVVVSYGDLNLSNEQGTRALYRRIVAAARQVCPVQITRELSSVAASNACQADAIARAVRELNNPQLAAVHAARSKHG